MHFTKQKSTSTLLPGIDSWSTRHKDSYNSDYYPADTPSSFEVKYQLLKNIPAATFVAVDEDKNMYVLTLAGKATSSEEPIKRLCSFDRQGRLRWTSAIMLTSLTSIGLSEGKYLYTTDGAYLYKLRTDDGSLVWKQTLPEESSAIMFLSETEILVLGILGNLYLFDGKGEVITPPYQLECKTLDAGVAHDYMPKKEAQFKVFQEALTKINVDPRYAKQAVNRFFGRGVAAKNVPAINQNKRLIYLLTSDATGTKSLLIALKHDPTTNTYHRQFTTTLGPGCDSSPNLSFDCSRIYCTAGNGELYAVDASTGKVYWTYQLKNSSSASINSTADHCIYISIKEEIVCIQDKGDCAEQRWQSRLTAESQRLGYTKAFVNSVLVISNNHVHAVASYTRPIEGMDIPFSHGLYTLDRHTGLPMSKKVIACECMCTPSFLDKNHLIVPSKPFYKGMKEVMLEKGVELSDDIEQTDFYGVVVYCREGL